MTPILYGVVAGIIFGAISVLVMLPMKFDNARQAYTASFFSRFSIGFVVPLIGLPLPMWASGLFIGLLISISDAIVTKAYAPILIMGTFGGGLVGLVGGYVLA
ncbi:MAG: hypothetical protein KDJ19_09345 [Hyphomicrobiaceae bacterium]|nr:hypothetical protein [Hyphomicrobiaceae bacterium]MCC0023069.1 hypothetical protein [Hyphomicrobiaceae bacterium]